MNDIILRAVALVIVVGTLVTTRTGSLKKIGGVRGEDGTRRFQ